MLLFACPSPIYQTLSPTVTSPDAESNEGIKVSGWVSLSRWRVDLVLQLEHSTERFRLRVSIPRRYVKVPFVKPEMNAETRYETYVEI